MRPDPPNLGRDQRKSMKTLLRFKILEPARNLIADLLVWFSDTDNCRAVRRPPLRDPRPSPDGNRSVNWAYIISTATNSRNCHRPACVIAGEIRGNAGSPSDGHRPRTAQHSFLRGDCAWASTISQSFQSARCGHRASQPSINRNWENQKRRTDYAWSRYLRRRRDGCEYLG